MVFDTLAWGCTLLVGFVMGIVYERTRFFLRRFDWDRYIKDAAERFKKDKDEEEKIL